MQHARGNPMVKFDKPKFKALPGELTPEIIHEGILPVKIEAMSHAIAACQSLPELLSYKRPIDGLAAAAKTIKEIPEYAQRMKQVQKEALNRLGELLSQYNGTPEGGGTRTKTPADVITTIRARLRAGEAPADIAKSLNINRSIVYHVKENPTRYGSDTMEKQISERTKITDEVGIRSGVAVAAVRFALAPKPVRDKVLADDRIPANITIMSKHVDPRKRSSSYSNAGSIFFNGISIEDKKYSGTRTGFAVALNVLKNIDLSKVQGLTPEEQVRARKLVVEGQEILDAIAERLDIAASNGATP
jgi:hypothetical protein